MTKPHLFLIGGATKRMIQAFNQHFTLHSRRDIDDIDGFLAEMGDKITAVATNGHSGISAKYMNAFPNLQVISCYGVGYDAIDCAPAVARGIQISHTPDVLNIDVANHALLLLLAASRNLIAEDTHARSGQWASAGNLGLSTSITGKTVGIIGLGRIGLEIARKLAAFDCDVVYHNRRKRGDVVYKYYDDLTQMARDCWAVIAITPGGQATQHLVDADVINAIGPQGIFVNVARGSVVDQPALIAALTDGRLGFAALDVFAAEPEIPDALSALPNTILTSHIASATHETRTAMGDLMVENLLEFFATGSVKTPVPECAHLC
ncbi:dihydrofolate reductase [Amylibacter marinus]|uniref:Dihydrofolate reductase n=1 Tax=Amylibacter marinus TaxID=1475483 RepID=A0ABQ5VWS5_9RHOB|nr:2-hydroxyacid dehydrogenase [Amylibacter marinus]GLQ35805.1 dihydrofolate reductase [Amylibacter marinus]